ncbi:hypothetical protein KEM54_001428 [Ascosphaera aggregata]|nr:hypothetical protein KEM54_001428 [Ascosphaera aggregata]
MPETPVKEESPAQRAARLRREKREAKIREGGASRLDRITGLSSGRVPSVPVGTQSPSTPSLNLASPASAKTSAEPVATPSSITSGAQPLDSELFKQQEQIRALLRSQDSLPGVPRSSSRSSPTASTYGQQPSPHFTRASEVSDDAELDVLNKLLSGNPNILGSAIPGLGSNSILGKVASLFAESGAPGFGQVKPEETPDPDIEKSKRRWKIVHFFFGIFILGYFLYMIHSSFNLYSIATAPVNIPLSGAGAIATDFDEFGTPSSVYPSFVDGNNLRIPPPASLQNPAVMFLLGELMLTALRGMLSGEFSFANPATWTGFLSAIITDSKIVIFGLGISSIWWSKEPKVVGIWDGGVSGS